MGKKFARRLLGIVLSAAFVSGAAMTARRQLDAQALNRAYAEAAQIAGLPAGLPVPEPSVEPIPGAAEIADVPKDAPLPEPLPEEAAALAGIDLAALRSVNEDVVGWIEIPGTGLSYPLMQGADNQFYLTHDWKGEANSGGSVFLECTGSRELDGFHTVAYGHRMRNGSMFGALKYYNDLNFWREHPSIYIAADMGVCRYDVFAAHEASVQGIVYWQGLEERGLADKFIRFCVDNSVIDTGIVPEAESRILTLSTCTGDGYADCWVVQGYLSYVYDYGAE